MDTPFYSMEVEAAFLFPGVCLDIFFTCGYLISFDCELWKYRRTIVVYVPLRPGL